MLNINFLTKTRWLVTIIFLFSIAIGHMSGTQLFHETFGAGGASARAWDNSYSVKSGVSAVYSGVGNYDMTNLKQGNSNSGSGGSGGSLIQTTKGTDAVFIVGPLNVASYTSLVVTYQWKASSIKGTYTTKLYYKTSSGGSFTEVSGTGTGATTYVTRTYNLPAAAQVSTLYLKVTFNTSNTQAYIDEFDLAGTAAAPAAKYTVSFDVGAGSPSQADIAEASAGAGITLPTGPTPTCSGDGWSFAGWQETSAVTSETTIAPTLLSAGSTYHPSENVTLYAVYRKSFPNYTKITNQSDLTTGDNYIIVANYSTKNYVMTNSYSTSGDYGRLAGSQIDETSTGVYSSASISSSYVFTITGSSNQWFVYNSTDSKYVDAGYKSFYLTKYDDADYWAITASAGAWSFVNHYNSNYIYYNGSSNIFSGESTSASLLLYKYSAYKYFSNPTCCTPLGSINGSFW